MTNDEGHPYGGWPSIDSSGEPVADPSVGGDAGQGRNFDFIDFAIDVAARDPDIYAKSSRECQRGADRLRADRGQPPWPGSVPVRPPSVPLTAEGVAAPGGNPRYVEAAIRDDLERLAQAHEGSRTRNDTLHRIACNVFEFVKGGHADEAAARAELTRISAANGLPGCEIESTLRSAWGRVGPRTVPAPGGVPAAHTIAPAAPPPRCRCCREPLTEPESKARATCLECRLFPPTAEDEPRLATS